MFYVNGFLRPKSKVNTKHIINSMLSKSCQQNASYIIYTRSQKSANNISIVSLQFFHYIYNLIIQVEGPDIINQNLLTSMFSA